MNSLYFSGLKKIFMVAFFVFGLSFSFSAQAQDDLTPLSDEFNSSSTLSNWSRLLDTEPFGLSRYSAIDVANTLSGWFTLVTEPGGWYADRVGELHYKEITGDFVATTSIHAQGVNGGPSNADYSLAGLMLRAPRDFAQGQREANGENYLFLTIGTASNVGTYQTETKNTINSQSDLVINNASSGDLETKTFRYGDYVILFSRHPGDDWAVAARFSRPDFPQTLQAGIFAYTDWESASQFTPEVYNVTTVNGNPDLIGQFDYVRFERPSNADFLDGLNLLDTNAVPDSYLLAAVENTGLMQVNNEDNENIPTPTPTTTTNPVANTNVSSGNSGGGGGGGGGSSSSSSSTNSVSTSSNTSTNNSPNPAGISFTDTSTHWARTYINDLTQQGIFNNATTFRPDDQLNRAELIKITIEAAYNSSEIDGCLSANTNADWTYIFFTDVQPTDWFAKYVCMARMNGVVEGYEDGTFKPSQAVNRAEALKIVFEALKKSVGNDENTAFNDVPNGSWFEKYVSFAVKQNIVGGKTSVSFAPGDDVTRAEIAKIVSLSVE